MTIYDCSNKATIKKDKETGEYVVRFHKKGIWIKEANYYTTDKQDAIGTAELELKRMR